MQTCIFEYNHYTEHVHILIFISHLYIWICDFTPRGDCHWLWQRTTCRDWREEHIFTCKMTQILALIPWRCLLRTIMYTCVIINSTSMSITYPYHITLLCSTDD